MDKDSTFEQEASKKPKVGRFKETSGRLRQGKEHHLSHRASLDWRSDRERVCLAGGPAAEIIPLEDIQAALMKSRTGETLLREATVHNVHMVYDAQTAQAQLYTRPEGCVIALNPYRPRGDLMGTLARELRRAWQYHQGALVNPMSFEPDEAVLVNRAQQADVFMVSIKVAWELKLAGETEAWDFMAGSPVAGVTRAFELRAQEDFRSLNNGEASRDAYDKFFEGSCTKMHDKRIIHQMLLDDVGYMKAQRKQARVGMDLFHRLGQLPHGSNYLSIRSKRAPTDMCYSTVEDRSNANFLWFIKFERSFQEKEMQMLKESVKTSAEIVDLAAWVSRTGGTPAN